MVDEVRPAGEAGVSSARSGENARMAASVRVAAAIACALFSFLATNGSIYPGLVSIDPWVREWATLFGVVVLAALVSWRAIAPDVCIRACSTASPWCR